MKDTGQLKKNCSMILMCMYWERKEGESDKFFKNKLFLIIDLKKKLMGMGTHCH